MDPRVASATRDIDKTYNRQLTVDELAARVNLSPARFSALFRRDMGVSPGRYLRAVRMERARVLLERTFLSVKEVMVFVGVHDPSHFARDFSRYHGVAPSRCRVRGRMAEGSPRASQDGRRRARRRR